MAALEAGPTGVAELRFWAVADRKLVGTIPIPHRVADCPFFGLHLAADDRTLFVPGEARDETGVVWLFDAVTRAQVGLLRNEDQDRKITSYRQVYAVATAPDGRVVMTGGDDANRAAVSAIQRDGTCWLGGTTWHGMAAMRISG